MKKNFVVYCQYPYCGKVFEACRDNVKWCVSCREKVINENRRAKKDKIFKDNPDIYVNLMMKKIGLREEINSMVDFHDIY